MLMSRRTPFSGAQLFCKREGRRQHLIGQSNLPLQSPQVLFSGIGIVRTDLNVATKSARKLSAEPIHAVQI